MPTDNNEASDALLDAALYIARHPFKVVSSVAGVALDAGTEVVFWALKGLTPKPKEGKGR